MTDQDQQSTETAISSESEQPKPVVDDQTLSPSNNETKVDTSNAVDSKPVETSTTRRVNMPQDVRYSTEPNDRDKLLEKYNTYEVSSINACNIRFLIDHRQKKLLLGHNESEEQRNLESLGATCNVNIFPGYQQSTKHSYKVFGTEANVRLCLMEVMNRIFKRSKKQQSNESGASTSEKGPDQRENVSGDEKPSAESQPTSIFVTTINPDSSITEETKPMTPSTPTVTEENSEPKCVPIERKREYTFVTLITSQGQEVLKKNWSFFAGALQQRLNVVVANPVRLAKFGDKQVHNELPITGESFENLVDAALQLAAFINDVLGIPVEPYQENEERSEVQHDDSHRRKSDKFSRPQGSPSSSANNYPARPFPTNRGRSDAFEQRLMVRTDCVARIVGKRGSNLKLIKSKCHLREIIVGRQADENGYTECILSAFQIRSLQFAIDTIRSFLRNEDPSAVIVIETNHDEQPSENASEPASSSGLSNPPSSQRETGSVFNTKSFQLGTGTGTSYPQPSYNFQNTPSFDFTHQATAASRKTDKRPGDLVENSPQLHTPSESRSFHHVHSSTSTYSSISPKHQSKRACPETKDIHCTTDEGFWISKQYYHALDDSARESFDALMEKLEKIRIDTEENAVRKQQRLAGRNRSMKSRAHPASISYLNEENQRSDKEETVKAAQSEDTGKVEQSTDTSEEKENQQDVAPVTVQ